MPFDISVAAENFTRTASAEVFKAFDFAKSAEALARAVRMAVRAERHNLSISKPGAKLAMRASQERSIGYHDMRAIRATHGVGRPRSFA